MDALFGAPTQPDAQADSDSSSDSDSDSNGASSDDDDDAEVQRHVPTPKQKKKKKKSKKKKRRKKKKRGSDSDEDGGFVFGGGDAKGNWHMKQFADRWSQVGSGSALAASEKAKTYDEKVSAAGMSACGSSDNIVKPNVSQNDPSTLAKGMSKLKFWGQ